MITVQEIEKILDALSIEEQRFIINHLNLKLKNYENDKTRIERSTPDSRS